MIPGQGAREDRHVILAQHQPRILLRGAAGNVDHGELAVRAPLDIGPLVFRHEIDRQRRDRQVAAAFARLHLLPIDMAAATQQRMADPPGHRIEDPARQRGASVRQRDHDAEGRIARREIAGPVDRIDDPVQPVASAFQYRRVSGAGFLADDAGLRQNGRQSFGKAQFAFLVGDGDEVIRRLLADFMRGEIAETRHHHIARHLPHQRDDGFVQGERHQLR